jgi:hypothetical protein
MPAMAEVVVAEMVEMPNLNQSRPATVVALRPHAVTIRPRSVTIAGRMGIAGRRRRIRRLGTSSFGTGRESRHQDHQHEESKFTHALDVVSP